jgi:hypothetical protein
VYLYAQKIIKPVYRWLGCLRSDIDASAYSYDKAQDGNLIYRLHRSFAPPNITSLVKNKTVFVV